MHPSTVTTMMQLSYCSVGLAHCRVMSIHPMKAFPSFLSTHHSAISSQIKRKAVNFMSAFMMLTINWPIPVLVYCLKTSNLTYAILSCHILPTKMSKTFAPTLINTSHLLCCMPVCYVTVGMFARLEQRSLVRLTKQK